MGIHLTSRLFVTSDLGTHAMLALNPEQSHYLQHVMRLRRDDSVRLFNGRDGEWLAHISQVSKKAVELTVSEPLRSQKSEPNIELYAAPIKKAHFDYMLEKTTELGVTSIHPMLTARTQVRDVNVERCQSIVTEAAEQSERLSVPDIKKPVTLQNITTHWPQDRMLIVCAEWGDAQPLQTVLTLPTIKSTPKIAIAIGPEGGFAAEELDLFRGLPNAIFVRLGPRILRADTAAIAALSCWQSVCGDWL